MEMPHLHTTEADHSKQAGQDHPTGSDTHSAKAADQLAGKKLGAYMAMACDCKPDWLMQANAHTYALPMGVAVISAFICMYETAPQTLPQ